MGDSIIAGVETMVAPLTMPIAAPVTPPAMPIAAPVAPPAIPFAPPVAPLAMPIAPPVAVPQAMPIAAPVAPQVMPIAPPAAPPAMPIAVPQVAPIAPPAVAPPVMFTGHVPVAVPQVVPIAPPLAFMSQLVPIAPPVAVHHVVPIAPPVVAPFVWAQAAEATLTHPAYTAQPQQYHQPLQTVEVVEVSAVVVPADLKAGGVKRKRAVRAEAADGETGGFKPAPLPKLPRTKTKRAPHPAFTHEEAPTAARKRSVTQQSYQGPRRFRSPFCNCEVHLATNRGAPAWARLECPPSPQHGQGAFPRSLEAAHAAHAATPTAPEARPVLAPGAVRDSGPERRGEQERRAGEEERRIGIS